MESSMFKVCSFCVALVFGGIGCGNAGEAKKDTADFKKITITNDFLSEGVAVADINKDGQMDVVAGYFWFEAPDWKRHSIAPSRIFDPTKEYSNSFLNFCMDVNQDGWDDLVLIDFPGEPAFWFENPQNREGDWKRHTIGDGERAIGIANESPAFVDVDGDGRLDILCADSARRQIVWLRAPDKGKTDWTRYPVSAENAPATHRFSHGIGLGDINKDGKNDVVVREGWWEGPADPRQPDWVFHPASLGEECSHMHVVDVNGDGKNDVVSASAHKLGMWWYEQFTDSSGNIDFRKHLFSESTSQTHASIFADLNGDGRADFITGKRYLAHHQNPDPGTNDPSLLLWFELTPGKEPYWIERQVDDDSGAGLNITTKDMNKDGKTDIIIANKKGAFVFINQLDQAKRQ